MNRKWKSPKMKHREFTKWKWLPYYPKNITIGKNVDIGAFTFLQGKYGIILDDNVQIGSHCSIYSYDTERDIKGEIYVHEGICIGSHSVILPKRGKTHHIKTHVKAGSVIY